MENIEKFRFIYDILRQEIKAQINSYDALDRKISLFMGFASASFLISVSIKSDMLGLNLVTLGFAIVFLADIFMVIGLWVRKFRYPPKPRTFLCEAAEKGYVEIIKQQCANIVAAFEQNEVTMHKKATVLKYALLIFPIGMAIALVGFIV